MEKCLCVNAGIHSQAPETLVPKKTHARCKACDTCSCAAASSLHPPVNYNFEEQQPIITTWKLISP